MIKRDDGISKKGITVKNPQANEIIERIHQMIGNIKYFKIYERGDINKEDPWSGMLSEIMFEARATYHNTLEATPTQLVYSRDDILPMEHLADLKMIQLKKQRLINLNNRRENSKGILHTYHLNDRVLLERIKSTKHGEWEYDGPYPITQVHNNGIIRIQKEKYSDLVNIRRVIPCFD